MINFNNQDYLNYFNNYSTVPTAEESEQHEDIVKWLQFSVTLIGFIGNLVSYITLSTNGQTFTNPTMLRLLKNQSVLDSIVCFIGGIFVLQPPMWRVSDHNFSYFICQFWHSQAIYWSFVLASTYNLLVIAAERYLAICYPFKHKEFEGRSVTLAILATYIFSFLADFPSFFQVSFRHSACTSTYYFEGTKGVTVFKAFACVILLTHFLFPAIAFTFLYGRIIYTLNKRKDQDNKLGSSRLITEANKQLTRTCVVVTIIFTLSLGYDITYYFIGRMGFVPYVKNNFLQKLGLFFSIFNSMANPIVYTTLLPSYRRAMVQTFCHHRHGKLEQPTSQEISMSSNTTCSHI